MSDALEIMKWPLIACLLLPGLLVYLGLHIVRREIIFVDLALAQVAALGTCAFKRRRGLDCRQAHGYCPLSLSSSWQSLSLKDF